MKILGLVSVIFNQYELLRLILAGELAELALLTGPSSGELFFLNTYSSASILFDIGFFHRTAVIC